MDHQHVGWYQSSQFGNFLSSQLLESQFSYQTSIEESVCLVFDTAKTSQGFLSVKAYRWGTGGVVVVCVGSDGCKLW